MMDNNGDTHDRQSADLNAELAALRRKLDRAETATRAAESLLEEKSSALYQANRELHQNKERLERLVFERCMAPLMPYGGPRVIRPRTIISTPNGSFCRASIPVRLLSGLATIRMGLRRHGHFLTGALQM